MIRFAVFVLGLTACTHATGTSPGTGAATAPATSQSVAASSPAAAPPAAAPTIAARPPLVVPPPAKFAKPWPIVIVLHGYGSSGAHHLDYLRGRELAAKGAIVLAPDGTPDSDGQRFWNVVPGFFRGPNVDDIAYVSAVIDDAVTMGGDPARVWLVGHSNGAYLAQLYACRHPEKIRGFVSIAGNVIATKCASGPHPLRVLLIHGTADDVVAYGPGKLGPGAEQSAAFWARQEGCKPDHPKDSDRLDLVLPAGAETHELVYACAAGADVTLLKMDGASHVPDFSAGLLPDFIWTWVGSP